MQTPSPPLPPLPLRRSHSHLDSATYRSLVRILSLCADGPLVVSAPPPPLVPPSGSGQGEETGLKGEFSRVNSVHDGTDDRAEGCGIGSGMEGHGGSSVGESPKDRGLKFLYVEELGHISQLPRGLGSVYPGSAGAQDEDPVLVDKLGDGKRQEELNECVCGNPNSLFDPPDGVFPLLEESEWDKGQEEHGECVSTGFQDDLMLEEARLLDYAVEGIVHQEKSQERCDTSVICKLIKEVVSEDSKAFDTLPGIFSSVEEPGGLQEDNFGSLKSSTAVSGPQNVGQDPATDSVGLIDGIEMEEGEISGEEGEILNEEGYIYNEEEIANEEHVLDLSVIEVRKLEKKLQPDHLAEKVNTADKLGSFTSDIMEEMINNNAYEFSMPVDGQMDKFTHTYFDDKMPKPQNKKKGGSRAKKDAKPKKLVSDDLSFPGGTTENFASQSKEMPADVKEDKVHESRKQGPLTVERKAKKKLAKKRKRAETNRKLGIKRLKILQIPKPKKVVYCKHYLKGRCHKGESCSFSHDTTPLTKSQPCRFFACHSCLKGDDCPFDHQLSKYPCHNYTSKGICSRGGTCMFSHEVPIMGGSTPLSLVSKPDSMVSSEKQSLWNQSNGKNSPSPALNNLQKSTALSAFMHDGSMEHSVEMKPKPPATVPKGIRFISCGKEALDDTDKQPNLSLKKGNNVQKRDLENQNVKDKQQTPSVFNTIASKESNAGRLSIELAAVPSSGSLESGVASATKILEEFLFGDGF